MQMDEGMAGSIAAGEGMAREGVARVLVVDDHPVVREGLIGLIGRCERYEVCAEAESIEMALKLAEQVNPDLVLVDLLLGGQDGLKLVRDYRSGGGRAPVLVISMQDEMLYAERALRAGAQGYLMKDADPKHILLAMDALSKGELYVSDSVNKKMLRKFLDHPEEPDSELKGLTDRELHVFQCIASGRDMHDIAAAMGLSVKTVETYRENIKRKLGLSSARELVRYSLAWSQGRDGSR
ncbi:MAG TPA: response regulator transcription factor [Kiritimatiellia bacterium]|nr:response regulator transcription factor [Kiritimatiellia bacterium]